MPASTANRTAAYGSAIRKLVIRMATGNRLGGTSVGMRGASDADAARGG